MPWLSCWHKWHAVVNSDIIHRFIDQFDSTGLSHQAQISKCQVTVHRPRCSACHLQNSRSCHNHFAIQLLSRTHLQKHFSCDSWSLLSGRLLKWWTEGVEAASCSAVLVWHIDPYMYYACPVWSNWWWKTRVYNLNVHQLMLTFQNYPAELLVSFRTWPWNKYT
jgi:hypothetical protein